MGGTLGVKKWNIHNNIHIAVQSELNYYPMEVVPVANLGFTYNLFLYAQGQITMKNKEKLKVKFCNNIKL